MIRSGKLLKTFTTAMLISVLFVMPVSAHGHHENSGHHNQTSESTDCPVCTVEDCTEEGRHTHDGHNYCGYNHESGYCDGSCKAAVSDKTDSGKTTSEKTTSEKRTSGHGCGKRRYCHV